jgi:hypothetical protein
MRRHRLCAFGRSERFAVKRNPHALGEGARIGSPRMLAPISW